MNVAKHIRDNSHKLSPVLRGYLELTSDEELYKLLLSEAGKGNALCQFFVSLAYEAGDHYEQDTTKAAEFMKLAYDQGLLEAREHWIRFLDNGIGVPQDKEEAKRIESNPDEFKVNPSLSDWSLFVFLIF